MFVIRLLFLLLTAIQCFTCEDSCENNENVGTSANGFTQAPCGQYGFRCIDNKRFQICPYRDGEGTTEEPEAVHECKEGYICDEDNAAYCTAFNPLLTTVLTIPDEGANEDEENIYDAQIFEQNYNSDYVNKDESSVVKIENNRNPRSADNCDCNTTPVNEVDKSTTTTTTTTEVPFLTTISNIETESFDCDNYGFYPDRNNKTLFWYCDVAENGNGFHIRHMKCGENRYFDPNKHACILEGTVRNDKRFVNNEQFEAYNSEQFSCFGKNSGKYPDDKNCHLYHICLRENDQPFNELLFLCPDKTAFDPSTQKCSRQATSRCLNNHSSIEKVTQKKGPEVPCSSPSRFRETSDCNAYYLCYGNQLLKMKCPEFYRVDDNIMECLPHGIAKCSESIL